MIECNCGRTFKLEQHFNMHIPNCHSLTRTYRFGNKGNGREIQRKYYKGKTTKKNLPVAK